MKHIKTGHFINVQNIDEKVVVSFDTNPGEPDQKFLLDPHEAERLGVELISHAARVYNGYEAACPVQECKPARAY